MRSDRLKGYVFAVVATIAYSNIYVFSKAALNEVHLAQFGVYWFLIAFSLNMAWFLKKEGVGTIFRLSRKDSGVLVLLGVLEILTTTFFFLSVSIIPDPAVTSFIGNLYPVILTFLGVVFLKETFTWTEALGGAVALLGAFIISYQGGTTLSGLFIPGAGVVLVNAFFASVASVVVKVNVKNMSPELINTNRTFWLLLYSLVLMFAMNEPWTIPANAMLNIAVGAVLGPFIGILMIYYSFRYLEVSKSSIVQSLKGICVLIGSYFYFRTFPEVYQLIGGLLTIAGVVLISMARTRVFRKKSKPGDTNRILRS